MLGKETEVNGRTQDRRVHYLSPMPQLETYRSSDWTDYSFVVGPLLVNTVRPRRFAAIVRNTLDWNLVIRAEPYG